MGIKGSEVQPGSNRVTNRNRYDMLQLKKTGQHHKKLYPMHQGTRLFGVPGKIVVPLCFFSIPVTSGSFLLLFLLIFNVIRYCTQWKTSLSTAKNCNANFDWPTYKQSVIYILSFFQILARTMKHYRNQLIKTNWIRVCMNRLIVLNSIYNRKGYLL